MPRTRPALVVAALAMTLTAMLVACGMFGGSEAPPDPRPSASPPVISPISACPNAQPGPLEQDTALRADGVEVNYSISLPAGYYDDCRTYPVVYALHGRSQNNASFMDQAVTLRQAMADGALAESIIVTPDSYTTGRWEDLDTGPAETNFIAHLIPHIESSYRVTPGPSERLLIGYSMGGHGAMRFGLKYPDMFAATWSVDGAMNPDSKSYLDVVADNAGGDINVTTVGGQVNGDRVAKLVDDLRAAGIDVPYSYQDVPHEFRAFVDADQRAGWPSISYLQDRLGRTPKPD